MNALLSLPRPTPGWARPHAHAELYLPRWDDIDSFSASEPPPALIPCPWCDGAGACDPCYGSGFLVGGFLCPWCGGSSKCHRCGGTGTIGAPGFVIVPVWPGQAEG